MKPDQQFTGQTYLSLETFRRSGTSMPTPVWFVQEGDRFYIRTLANSGKVKRVRNNPGVNIAACDREGKITGSWVRAVAHELCDDPAVEAKVDQLLDEKYGEAKRQLARQAAETGSRYTILEVKIPKKEEE
jgi:PPOX class probable F420-dependent enzyme